MHAADLMRLLNQPGNSTLKTLSRHSTLYPNAFTTAPSDSFPGMVAQVTGATPKTAGVFYDDSYDRTFFPPGSNCAGQPGAETTYAENIDVNQNLPNAGGTLGEPLTQIDPAKLPRRLVNGKCEVVFPHQFIRANTIFEIIKAAGLRTAWADKHPAYEILNGPSGKGIDDLFTPEVNSLIPGYTSDNTASFTAIRGNDSLKVQAVLNEIDGYDSRRGSQVGVPAIMGLDFQAVSVGEKLAASGPLDPPGLVGGYLDANATPGAALAGQFAFVDQSIGSMVAELKKQNLYGQTLIIISAKHGQSPIDRSLRVAVDDSPYANMPGYGFHIADDEGLIWMKPQTRTPALIGEARAFLEHNAATLHIEQILGGRQLDGTYRNPITDSRTPDFIAVSTHGVVYTTGSKLAEHGGFSDDDRNVALMVSAPQLTGKVVQAPVMTTQIAPTILTALGLDATQLDGVRKEVPGSCRTDPPGRRPPRASRGGRRYCSCLSRAGAATRSGQCRCVSLPENTMCSRISAGGSGSFHDFCQPTPCPVARK